MRNKANFRAPCTGLGPYRAKQSQSRGGQMRANCCLGKALGEKGWVGRAGEQSQFAGPGLLLPYPIGSRPAFLQGRACCGARHRKKGQGARDRASGTGSGGTYCAKQSQFAGRYRSCLRAERCIVPTFHHSGIPCPHAGGVRNKPNSRGRRGFGPVFDRMAVLW